MGPQSNTTEQLTHKGVIRGEFMHYVPVIKKKKKKEQSQISDLSFHLKKLENKKKKKKKKKLENKEQMKFKVSRRKTIQD